MTTRAAATSPRISTVWEYGCLDCPYSTVGCTLPGTPYQTCPVCRGQWALIGAEVYRDGKRDEVLERAIYTNTYVYPRPLHHQTQPGANRKEMTRAERALY